MASRVAKSLDFPELIAALAGVAVGDEVTVANLYAGTSKKDMITALNLKAGTTGKDLPDVLRILASAVKGSDVNACIKKLTG